MSKWIKYFVVALSLAILLLGTFAISSFFKSNSQSLSAAIASDDMEKIRTILVMSSREDISKHENLFSLVFDRYLKGTRDPLYVTEKDKKEYRQNTVEIVGLLIEKGADINKLTRGMPPLYLAIKLEYDELAHLMIEKGADVNAFFEDDVPLLYWVALVNRIWVPILIEYGADINIRNTQGNTPLHIAVLNNLNADYISLFLKHGANVSIQNNSNETAIDIAKRKSFRGTNTERMLQLLEEQNETGTGILFDQQID